jgi:rhamnose utilization protein RhaD (predicted bifunctional aldolase and dehydrogenase)
VRAVATVVALIGAARSRAGSGGIATRLLAFFPFLKPGYHLSEILTEVKSSQ